jgi:SAM-dependent methyltransferase
MLTPPPIFSEWLAQLDERHLADLRVPEVTRALRALSSAYVERRHKVVAGATLDTAGKRAAFALFYAPLHFLATFNVVDALGIAASPRAILDLGCGTGAAGAAWAIAGGGTAAVTGIDRHPWAVHEARWTFKQFELHGQARQGDLARLPTPKAGTGIVAAYVLNEMDDEARGNMEAYLLGAPGHGAQVLVLEPIARAVTPWWHRTAARVVAAGGRADEWKFAVELPSRLQLFDRAAGLNHRELKLRSLYLPSRASS